jgi:protein phosphatase
MGHGPDVRVEIGRLKLRAGDKVLLCSDGLSNEVSAAEMQQALAASRPPLEACRNLIALANQRGGNDNVTVIVAELRETAAGP